uniref:Uncharacterized protein n=1 Tax=Medicago truncatula TaxID=3880 RepID=I3SHR9_MEDTR|nr:unknown [Medicago truncatula]
MWNEHSRRLGGSTNFFHSVKVLSDKDHIHDIFCSRPWYIN